ncbi:MAG: alpha/beta hydrolase [Gemmatimonadaceae bacterium]|nr:alpha/beta hydrolase [Gemmatimonadaceae bacterium]
MAIGFRTLTRCAVATGAMLMVTTVTAFRAVSQSAAVPPLPTGAAVTRADLGAAYLRLDKAYAAASLDDSTRRTINQQFDRSTLSFFTGRFAAAVAGVDSATVALTGSAIAPAPFALPRLVNGRAPSVARDAFLARLATIDTTGPLAQAFVSARARAELLVDVPSRERSAEFLSDPAQLARDLAHEVGVLERGRDPYVGQAGDLWRVFRGANGVLIPLRIVAPAAAATSGTPVPVLIALHGAGGDENMFIDAYGQGVIATLALAANTIVVSPATSAFGVSPANFDSLMAVLRSEYRVNTARVYVLGHSMGAGVAARLAQQRPQQITAVACLAGGSAVAVPNAPPIMFISAALDPIAPPRIVEAAANGTPTATYRVLANEGHTLMVGNGVRMALPWLLAHRP